MTKSKTQVIIRKNIDRNDVEVLYANAVGIIRATSYESMCLWKSWHQEGKRSWEQSREGGQLVTVGHISGNKNRPVCVSVFANKIEGRWVLFIEATSRWVDYTMVDEWLRLSFPNIESRYDTDAMNFHIVVHQIDRLNEEKVAA